MKGYIYLSIILTILGTFFIATENFRNHDDGLIKSHYRSLNDPPEKIAYYTQVVKNYIQSFKNQDNPDLTFYSHLADDYFEELHRNYEQDLAYYNQSIEHHHIPDQDIYDQDITYYHSRLSEIHSHFLNHDTTFAHAEINRQVHHDSYNNYHFDAAYNLNLNYLPYTAVNSFETEDQNLDNITYNEASITPENQHFLILRRNQGPSLISGKSYTTLEAFSFPLTLGNIHPFVDLRYHLFDKHGDSAASVGLGFRFENCANQIFGVNAYYDFRQVHRCHFNQLGLGFEVLGNIWSLRLNAYQPVGKKHHRVKSCLFKPFDEFDEDFFILRESYYDSLKGADFEIEAILKECCWGNIRLALGSYYYSVKRGCHKSIYGPEIRLSSDICDFLSLSVLATYDKVFKTRIQAQIGLILPFYFLQSDDKPFHIGNSNRRLYQPVHRNDSIIIKKRNRLTWNF